MQPYQSMKQQMPPPMIPPGPQTMPGPPPPPQQMPTSPPMPDEQSNDCIASNVAANRWVILIGAILQAFCFFVNFASCAAIVANGGRFMEVFQAAGCSIFGVLGAVLGIVCACAKHRCMGIAHMVMSIVAALQMSYIAWQFTEIALFMNTDEETACKDKDMKWCKEYRSILYDTRICLALIVSSSTVVVPLLILSSTFFCCVFCGCGGGRKRGNHVPAPVFSAGPLPMNQNPPQPVYFSDIQGLDLQKSGQPQWNMKSDRSWKPEKQQPGQSGQPEKTPKVGKLVPSGSQMSATSNGSRSS